jgi:hypothetical protein
MMIFVFRVIDSWTLSKKPTHLICKSASGSVFDNVNRLGGVIVNQDWVTESVKANRRLNEINFEFNDESGGADEDPTDMEVFPVSGENFATGPTSLPKPPPLAKSKPTAQPVASPKASPRVSPKLTGSSVVSSKAVPARAVTAGDPESVPKLPNLFRKHKVYVDTDNTKNAEEVIRYLGAFGGSVTCQAFTFDKTVTIVISDGSWNSSFSTFLKKSSGVKIVNSLWAWDSINTQTLQDPKTYLLKQKK